MRVLPQEIFVRLQTLKWIDLRNNQLTEIPSDGLAKHTSLRYLLLGGNLIRTLPVELGKRKSIRPEALSFFSFNLRCLRKTMDLRPDLFLFFSAENMKTLVSVRFLR